MVHRSADDDRRVFSVKSQLTRLVTLAVTLSLLIPVYGQAASINPAAPASGFRQDDSPGQTVVYLPVVSSGIPTFPPIIPETTNVLPQSTTQYLASLSSSGIFTFTQATSELDALAPGEIIVGEPSTKAPNGFLRRVTDVASSGTGVVVTTGPATIEDAIEQGSLHFSQTLDPSMIAQSEQLPGVTVNEKSPDVSQGEFQVQIYNVLLYDKDGFPFTTDDQVRANGSSK
jgi:hypothetical protein